MLGLGFLIAVLTLSTGGSAGAAPELTIVALGDSTTAGTPGFLSPAENPPNGSGNPESQYSYWMMKLHPEWKILNRGIAGQRSDQIFQRFDRDVLGLLPQAVIVLAGVNDLYQGYPPEWVESHLQDLYERAARANLKVVACTILPFNQADSKTLSGIKAVNQWIQRYSQEHGLGFCDTYSASEDPSHPGNLAGSSDGLHPDVATYRKIGQAIAFALEKYLVQS